MLPSVPTVRPIPTGMEETGAGWEGWGPMNRRSSQELWWVRLSPCYNLIDHLTNHPPQTERKGGGGGGKCRAGQREGGGRGEERGRAGDLLCSSGLSGSSEAPGSQRGSAHGTGGEVKRGHEAQGGEPFFNF